MCAVCACMMFARVLCEYLYMSYYFFSCVRVHTPRERADRELGVNLMRSCDSHGDATYGFSTSLSYATFMWVCTVVSFVGCASEGISMHF